MKFVQNVSVNRQLKLLVVAFAILALLVLLTGLLQIRASSSLAGHVGNLALEEPSELAKRMVGFSQILTDVEALVERAKNSGNPQTLAQEKSLVAKRLATLASPDWQSPRNLDAHAGHLAPSERKTTELQGAMDAYRDAITDVLEVLTSDPALALQRLLRVNATFNRLTQAFTKYLEQTTQQTQATMGSHLESMRSQAYLTDIPVALVAIFLLMWAGLVTRRMSKNFSVVNSTLAQLGRGNTDVAIEPAKYQGEVAETLTHLNHFKETLTQLKLQSEDLNDTNARRVALSESSLDALITIDDKGKLVDFNDAAQTIFGHRREQVIRQEMSDLIIPPQYRAAHHKGMNNYLASGEGPILSTRVEITALRADGSEFPVELTVVPFKSRGKTYFMGSVRDHSEKAKIEAEKAKVAKLLQESLNDRIARQFAIDQHAIVSITDVTGKITYTNEKFSEICGFSPEQLLGSDHRLLKSDVQDQGFFKSMWDTIAEGNVWHGEICNKAKNGRLFWLSSTIVPMVDSEGQIYEYIAISTDMTAQKHVEANLIDAKANAEAANEAKSQFLANMSHEIRTPLNAMMGMLQLLRKTGLSDKQLDFATKSHSAALFLQRLLNDILDFSKIEANMLVFDAQPFALKDLMQEVSHVLQSPASDKGLALKVDTEALAGRVIGDEHRLRQVLLNLGSNAIKFTPSGSVHIKAEVISQNDHAVELLFSVRDTGIGIAAEQRANIFKSFTQAEASTTRRFGGSGLGLSISNGLVKLMGSHIRLQSQPGQGSTFSFRINLPLADEASQDAAQQVSQDTPAAQPSALGAVATEHHHPSAELASAAASSAPVPASKATASTPLTSAKPLKGLRVLVVEDSPMNQEVAKGLLEDEGAQVEVAENGQTGLDAVIAANPPFDAVLMDIQMPVMDGFVSTMAIRRIPQFQDLPIIAMTANAMASDRDKCFAIGMNGYIGKPYDIAEVVATLLRATAKHREQKAQGSPSKPGAGGSGLSWADAAVSESTLAVGAAHNIELPLALKRMGGKIGIYKRMLHSFSQDIGGIAGQLRALSPDSPESAMRLLHSFKGSAGMLGFRALSERLAQAERDLKQSARPSLEPEAINALSALIDTEQKAAAALLSALDDDLAQQKAHQAQSRSTLTPSELEAFSADMHRLIALLEASNMSAVDLFEQIHAKYPQMLGAAASSLQKAIDTLAFKNAAELCEDLLLSST